MEQRAAPVKKLLITEIFQITKRKRTFALHTLCAIKVFNAQSVWSAKVLFRFQQVLIEITFFFIIVLLYRILGINSRSKNAAKMT